MPQYCPSPLSAPLSDLCFQQIDRIRAKPFSTRSRPATTDGGNAASSVKDVYSIIDAIHHRFAAQQETATAWASGDQPGFISLATPVVTSTTAGVYSARRRYQRPPARKRSGTPGFAEGNHPLVIDEIRSRPLYPYRRWCR